MDPCRLAAVRYLNTLPLVYGLEKVEGLTLVPAVPSAIIGMLERGEADMALASVVDLVRSPLALAAMSCGVIASDGPTMTVRLFSRVPMREVTHLHADTDSHTSVILAQVVLRRVFGRVVKVVRYDARERVSREGPGVEDARPLREAWPETVLLIGDKVVVDGPPGDLYPHQLDLGEAWKQMTGLPFVYAVWMCRQEEAHGERVKLASALLERQKRHNRTRLDAVVAQGAKDHRWPLERAREYVGTLLRYDLGQREREAMVKFLEMAAEEGLVPRREVVFAGA